MIQSIFSPPYAGEYFLENFLDDPEVHSDIQLKLMVTQVVFNGLEYCTSWASMLCLTYLNIYMFSILKLLYLHINAAVHIC